MRIWVLTNEYAGDVIGGLGVVATNLSKALARRDGVHVTVICKGPKRSVTVTERPSLTVIRFPRGSRYHSYANQTFLAEPIAGWLKRRGIPKPDVIQIHSLQCDKLAEYFKWRYGTPVIYTCHSTVAGDHGLRGWEKMAARQERVFRIADAVTVPSEWQKSVIRRLYPDYYREIQVIRNGVSGSFRKRRRRVSRYRLLYVGRLTRNKGIAELLRAVALLRRNHRRVRLHLVGGGSRYYSLRFKKLARQLRLTRRVRWLGKRHPLSVQRTYRNYGAVVVPSKHESFGLVALEAMASGVPLVATRNGGLASFVHDGNAQVIAGVTPSLIASAIRRMWSDPALTAGRAEQAEATARAYQWADISGQYHELFYRYRRG
ncbi:glycosyltransferase [Cohnella sp. CFH 77786]|uniref:glycosyltransferase family 4 protein n=1 Tax=Cohnella sp. CFH 77786 TaxID=2662265 RepID=UPI001C60F987|nr:glycosyltransferase family 4 protein [Cohnella sp. CFH 77786]MBW5446305.1 glycosyltransferase [Cohnella sp. CFH 77786]